MTASIQPRPALGTSRVRWIAVLSLLGAEYLALSLAFDLPEASSAGSFLAFVRMAAPVAIGSVTAALLASRSHGGLPASTTPLPGGGSLAALPLNLAAFVATFAVAARVLGGSAAQVTIPALCALLALCAATAATALAIAIPLRRGAHFVLARWRSAIVVAGVGAASLAAAAAAESLWGLLSGVTLRSVAALLRCAGGDVVLRPADVTVGLDDFVVHVAPVCSGVSGVGLVVTFQVFWIASSASRLHVHRALLLLPVGIAAALVANAARIAALVVAGARGHPDLAYGGFHSHLGWVFFCAIALGTVICAEGIDWLRREPAVAPLRDDGAAPVAFVAPLVAALAGALLTAAFARGGIDRLYVVRIAAALVALFVVRRSLGAAGGAPSWRAVAIGGAVGVAWVLAAGGDHASAAAGLARLPPTERTALLATRLLGSVLVIPLVEELAFRGFLLHRLASLPLASARVSTVIALSVSSLAFGAIHGSIVLGTVAGAAFGAAQLWRGRIGDAVVAHATANAVVAAGVLVAGRWALWS